MSSSAQFKTLEKSGVLFLGDREPSAAFENDSHNYLLAVREILRASLGRAIVSSMTHTMHENHSHDHGANCAHSKVKHAGHVDYLHDGHMHHVHEGHIDEHAVEVSTANPNVCTDAHACGGHEANHKHGVDCGHEPVPHGDHTDHLVQGHLHHGHGAHCDDHGVLQLA